MIGTPKQIALLDFIGAYIAEHRVSPNQREMGDHMRTSVGNINRMLAALERNGHIWRMPRVSRGIRLHRRGTCPHCRNEIGSEACRIAASIPITYSSTPKQQEKVAA
jgi:SOS-response transcriptional repressor LexA